MSNKFHLENEEDDHGNWPNDIRLQVLEIIDAGSEIASSAAEHRIEPAGVAVPPLPWSVADPADDLISETPSWPPPEASSRVIGTRRPRSHEAPAASAASWLEGEVPSRSAEAVLAPVRDDAPAPKAGGDGATAGAGDASASSGSNWQEFCRICHDGGERAPLITACRCNGSMQHVHNDCLIHWILSSFNTHCEICLHRYKIGTTGMRLPHQWKLPTTDGVERYHMMLCLVALVVLAAVVAFLIYVSTDEGREATTYRNSPLAPALYAVYAVLGLVCIGLASAELHYTICPLVERFRLTNMELLVVPFNPNDADDDSDSEALSSEYDFLAV